MSKPKVWLPGEFTPLERATMLYRLAVKCAALEPHQIIAVPVLTRELKDAFEEAITGTGVPEVERLTIVYAH